MTEPVVCPLCDQKIDRASFKSTRGVEYKLEGYSGELLMLIHVMAEHLKPVPGLTHVRPCWCGVAMSMDHPHGFRIHLHKHGGLLAHATTETLARME